MKIDSHFDTDTGKKRNNNEDAAGKREPTDSRELRESGRLYIVADGLGGHERGEFASQYAVETLIDHYFKYTQLSPEQRLREIIEKINQGLIDYSKKNLQPGQKSATTVVAAAVRQGKLLLANVGDSRAYLVRDNKVTLLSRDHSYVGEMVRAGVISEAEAQASKYKNRLTRSLGSDPNLEVDVYEPSPLRSGDIIILCSDGLTQYASSEDLLAASYGSAKEIVERLIDFANAHGGTDNITVSAIRYGDKRAWPGSLKAAILGSLVVLALAVFTALAWYGLSKSEISLPWSTTTPTPTMTSTPIPAATATSTTAPTATPIPTETPSIAPEPTQPAPEGLVDCEYIVQAGNFANQIATKFNVDLAQIYRLDGSQTNMNSINTGETLIIKGTSTQACLDGGGQPQEPNPESDAQED
jgi:protein phosphatase